VLGDEVATYLAGAGLGLSLTTSSSNGVFAVPFPPLAGDTATCVIEYGGRENVDAFGPSLSAPIFQRPRFQVVCRDSADNALACRTLAESIYKKLRHFSGTLSGVTYGFVKAHRPPFFLNYDENQRIHYAINFEAHKTESP